MIFIMLFKTKFLKKYNNLAIYQYFKIVTLFH